MATEDLIIGGVILFFFAAVIVVIIVALPKRKGMEKNNPSDLARLDYEAVAGLLSAEEAVLYANLLHMFDGTAIICPKIKLTDVIQPRSTTDNGMWRQSLNKVIRKNLDFVCLRPDDFSAFGVIELEHAGDASPAHPDIHELLRTTLESAGIRLCILSAATEYDYETLYEQIMNDFGLSSEPVESIDPIDPEQD